MHINFGGLDMINTQSLNVEENIGIIGSNVRQIYGRNFDYIALNTTNTILSNNAVRQAINYGVNKQEIINTIYNGKYFSADYPLEYGNYLYNKDSKNNEYSKEKAKEILQNDGWNFSNGEWRKNIGHNTVRIRLNLVVQSSNENRVNISNIIKNNLEDIRYTNKCNTSK